MITRRWIGIAIMLTALLVVAAPAAAAKIKLGKVAPSGADPGSCTNCEAFVLTTAPASPSYVVPHGRWTITSWRAQGDKHDHAQARLRIYRPTPPDGHFKLLDQSSVKGFRAGTASGHKAHIHVRTGDLLGIETIGSMPMVYYTNHNGDETASPNCDPQVGDSVGTGTSCGLNSITQSRVNVAATLRRRH
jgi:hypothetical protein